MTKQKILIATTNTDKFKEMVFFLGDLPFIFLSLNDLKKKYKEPIESESTIEGNAALKAKYYALKTGLISIADDTGLFIKTLDGWPGVRCARSGTDGASRNKVILNKLKGVPFAKRGAIFKAALSVYNPHDLSNHIIVGETAGKIVETEAKLNNGFGYDTIFHVDEKNKLYTDMDMQEKNSCSHRGKALVNLKYFLQNQFGAKHIVVPIGIIIKNGLMMLSKRNDPHRPEFHERWEFPGGSVEFGESLEQNLTREVYEEIGLKIKPLKQLQNIYVREQEYPNFKYQVYLIPYICKIVGGSEKFNNAEVLDIKWIKPGVYSGYKFVGTNHQLLQIITPELKQTIKEYKL